MNGFPSPLISGELRKRLIGDVPTLSEMSLSLNVKLPEGFGMPQIGPLGPSSVLFGRTEREEEEEEGEGEEEEEE